MKTMYDECLEALQAYKILPDDEGEKVVNSFESDYPITFWARVDWDKHMDKFSIQSNEEIIPIILQRLPSIVQPIPIYIIWDNMSHPVLKCDLEDALKVVDDVTAVSFDTWLYSPSPKFVVEFYHEGEITIGFA